ncbi:MAG TPA: hypothetical protein PKD51_08410 [Saprospiraceae bacterium]|nr:hypothetical protein [Saprospiraceae bacterium]HMU02429.1 hypothetical protein [Saprospiraceae bacterium]
MINKINKFQKIENREKNIKLELSSGIVALIVSLFFVFSNHLANFYQIYYVVIIFGIHQVVQLAIFNKFDISPELNSKKIWLRIILSIFFILLTFWDLGQVVYEVNYIGFRSESGRFTFLSVAIYSVIYFSLYFIQIKIINKNQQPKN